MQTIAERLRRKQPICIGGHGRADPESFICPMK